MVNKMERKRIDSAAATSQLSSTRRPESGGRLRTVLFGLVFIPWTLLCSVCSIMVGLVPGKRAFSFIFAWWSRVLLAAAGVRCEVVGLERLRFDRPYLFICNHQSALDIPLLAAQLARRCHLRFLAKDSLFRIPFFGWALSLNDFISVDRRDARDFSRRLARAGSVPATEKSAVAAGGEPPPETAAEAAKPRAEPRCSFMLFPEGTRSADGRLQPFRQGAFNVALRIGLDVVPLTLVDACRVNPKKQLRIYRGKVRLFVHEPISPRAVRGAEGGQGEPRRGARGRKIRDRLAVLVRRAMISELPEDQRPVGEEK